MITSGMNLRTALKIARQLGARVEAVPGTGELRFSHPSSGRVRVNARRHDASRALTVWLRRLEQGVAH